MSDQYPDVSSDESGLVPPTGMRQPEWPKKIRTLTAAELDRLTIDGDGRFYWDGRAVAYSQPEGGSPGPGEPGAEAKPADPLDHSLDALDRAALELKSSDLPDFSEHTTADAAKSSETSSQAVDYDALVAAAAAGPAVASAMVPARSPAAGEVALGQAHVSEPIQMSPMVYGIPDKMHVSLSGWQSIGMILVVLSLLVAAIGIALSGFVAVHDWGCRAGIMRSYCPANAPGPPPPPEIPA